jgi:hypothetical protein
MKSGHVAIVRVKRARKPQNSLEKILTLRDSLATIILPVMSGDARFVGRISGSHALPLAVTAASLRICRRHSSEREAYHVEARA